MSSLYTSHRLLCVTLRILQNTHGERDPRTGSAASTSLDQFWVTVSIIVIRTQRRLLGCTCSQLAFTLLLDTVNLEYERNFCRMFPVLTVSWTTSDFRMDILHTLNIVSGFSHMSFPDPINLPMKPRPTSLILARVGVLGRCRPWMSESVGNFPYMSN